jgi:hypothetical protein
MSRPCAEIVKPVNTKVATAKPDPHGPLVEETLESLGVRMKKALALLLCVLFPAISVAAESGYKVTYDGGSIPAKSGSDLHISIDSTNVHVFNGKTEVATIPSASITEVSYGLDVHRRVGAAVGVGVFTLGLGAMMLLSKSKKHFVGLTWDDNGKKGGFAVQADKNDYRGILAGLEGVSGKKAVDSDAMNVKN